jgi:hypothetical protein
MYNTTPHAEEAKVEVEAATDVIFIRITINPPPRRSTKNCVIGRRERI